MIENEDIGLKIAESEAEGYWLEVVEKTKQEIQTLNKMLMFNHAVLNMAQEKAQEQATPQSD